MRRLVLIQEQLFTILTFLVCFNFQFFMYNKKESAKFFRGCEQFNFYSVAMTAVWQK